MEKIDPGPSVLFSTQILPFMRLTNERHRFSPRPVPVGCPIFSFPTFSAGWLSSCENFRKRRFSCPGDIPGPSSATDIATTWEHVLFCKSSLDPDANALHVAEWASSLVSTLAVARSVPPTGEYLIALDIRLIRTYCGKSASVV